MQKLEAVLQSSEVQLQDKKAKVAQATVQWEACFHLVAQFKSSLIESGQDCSVLPGEEDMEAATKQIGIGPILKMYYSNVKNLSAFAATKSALESELLTASTATTATSTRLLALQAYLDELAAGKDAVRMRPLPSCYEDDVVVPRSTQPLLPPSLKCSICSDGFPLWDVILCSCQHVYHPWCAAQWFRSNVRCAALDCGLVPPLWYNSWGFGQYNKLLAEIEKEGQRTTLPDVPSSQLLGEARKTALGNASAPPYAHRESFVFHFSALRSVIRCHA